MTTPYYTALSQEQLDVLATLIRDHGYHAIVAGIGDYLTQNGDPCHNAHAEMSLQLGALLSLALQIDKADGRKVKPIEMRLVTVIPPGDPDEGVH